MISVVVTQLAAAQFTDQLITDFLGEGAPGADADIQIALIGYSYNSQGAAHTQRLYLTPTGVTDANFQIELFNNLAGTAGNSFANLCGRNGVVVPRYTPPSVPFELRLTTVGKTDDGSITVWYTKQQLR